MVYKFNKKTIRQVQSSDEIRKIKLSLVDFIPLVPLPHQNHSSMVLNAKDLQTSIISDTTHNAHLFGNIREFMQRRLRRQRKRHLQSEFALLPQTWSHLLHLVKFVKCWQSFLQLNSNWLHQSSGKEKERCCFLSPSSTKREIRQFHVAVVQRRQRNDKKNVLHVQSCCFACLNLLLFCRSRYHRRSGYFSEHWEQYSRGTQLSAKYLFHQVFTAAKKFQ